MGCGQSKIGNLYSRNKKNKSFGRNGVNARSASIEQKNGNGNNKGTKTNNNGPEVNRNEEQNGSPDKSQAAKKKPIGVPPGGPLLQQTEISTSQLDFFRMLDEKIESGPDYDESTDGSHRAEHVTGLLRRWELASSTYVTESNPTSLSKSKDHPQHFHHQQQAHMPNRALIGLSQQPRQQHHLTGALSTKDREGMRNIVGGRPEQSAPIYVQRVATNRLDGLLQQDAPCSSMPRHVLESISQSPTQGMKNPPGSQRPYYGNHPDLQRIKLPGKPIYAGASLNGEYSSLSQQQSLYQGRSDVKDYPRQQQSYDSLVRNSPSNPYVQQFQITSPSSAGTRKQPHRAGAPYQMT